LVAGGETIAHAGKAVDGVVNLNTAPADLLGLLPGIGPAKAAAIVRYRQRRPFRTVDELVRIRGIGRKQVRLLRAHLAIAGPSTATVASGQIPVAAPPPPPAVRPPARPLCRPLPAPKRPTRERWPSHGSCPRPA
jgi:competence ComEA-like helix-hairpin-helix protein